MRNINATNFGPLIAYLLPGLVALWGVGQFSPTIQSLLLPSVDSIPTVGGFLYVTLASTAAGLIVSAARWAIVDTVFHHTGIKPPKWNFQNLPGKADEFLVVVENTYRFFQFYSNMLTAVTFAYGAHLVQRGFWPPRWLDVGVAVVWIILFAGSRDTLGKYYARTKELLETP